MVVETQMAVYRNSVEVVVREMEQGMVVVLYLEAVVEVVEVHLRQVRGEVEEFQILM
jgi:hypothetical protein